MEVGDKTVKVPVCFLCLRNMEETPGLNGCNNGDLDLLRRFLCLSLELPPAVVVGDLLCSNVRVAIGAGHDGQGHGDLLCGSCVYEVRATCQLYRDLARKLKELERILEKSTEAVSETVSVNLHEKVATQLSGNGGGGGDRVKRLRNLLASKLHKRGRKLAGEDEDESRTLKKSQPMSKSNLNQDNAEVTEDGDFENEENGILNMVKVEMDDDNEDYLDMDSDHDQIKAMGRITVKDSAPVVVGWNNRSGQSSDDDDDEVKKRPFQCLRCDELFETIEAVGDHMDVCRDTRDRPMENERKMRPKPEKAQKKRSARNAKVGTALKRVKSEGKGSDGSSQKKCRFCGKQISNLIHLTAHERVHTGEIKPFECGKCKTRFNDKSNCKRHQLKCRGKPKAKIIRNGVGDGGDSNRNGNFQQLSGQVETDVDADGEEEETPGGGGGLAMDELDLDNHGK